MLVLDENLPAAQQLWLRKWRSHRMGTVIRVNPGGLSYWCVGRRAQDSLPWPEP